MQTKRKVAGIIVKDGKLLMVIGKGYSELWTPGGKIDGNETDIEALTREIKEEIGATLIDAVFFKEYLTENFYSKKYKILERVYVCTIEGDIQPDAEIESIIWFTKEDFKNKKFLMIPYIEEEFIPDLIKAGIW